MAKTKQTRRKRQGQIFTRCRKCTASVGFDSWMALNRFMNGDGICGSCKQSAALAEDTFARVERSEQAIDQFYRTHG